MPRRKASRVRHRVTFTTEQREIGNTPMKIIARKGTQRVGRLFIARGGVSWYPRNAKVGHEFTWEAFSRQMAKP